jgi:hypothetical protein
VIRFYGLSDTQVLDMPINRFWMLNTNIDRISAQEDYRAARAHMASQSTKDGIQSYFDGLTKEMGTVIVRDDTKPDYEGIERLKGLAQRFR